MSIGSVVFCRPVRYVVLTDVLTVAYRSLIDKEILNRITVGLSGSIKSQMCIIPVCL